jgi:small GTP-binding protein
MLQASTLHTVGTLHCKACCTALRCRFKLNIWDVGGQKTLRPYWRNYYEKTDGLIWVVDSADLARLEDCKQELHALLQEERLYGATLLILANKQDIAGALSLQEIEQVAWLESNWSDAYIKDITSHDTACNSVTDRPLLILHTAIAIQFEDAPDG